MEIIKTSRYRTIHSFFQSPVSDSSLRSPSLPPDAGLDVITSRQSDACTTYGYQPPSLSKTALMEETIVFLSSWKYKWFLTLTFRDISISEFNARRALRVFVSIINKRLYGKRLNEQTRLKFVAVLERNSSDGIHFHLLIIEPNDAGKLDYTKLIPDYLIELWKDKIDGAGSNNHWKNAEDRHISYICKDLSRKDDCLIFDWLPNHQQFN